MKTKDWVGAAVGFQNQIQYWEWPQADVGEAPAAGEEK